MSCDDDSIDTKEDSLIQVQPQESKFYAHKGLAKYEPEIELHFVRETGQGLNELINHLPGETLEKNRWTELYKQMLGINIIYDWKAEGDVFSRKLGSVITSGNIPDVVWVNDQQLRQLYRAGLIEDLTAVYEEYATSFTKEVYTMEGSRLIESATIDGKMMGIPQIDSPIEKAQYIWIRTDWLEYLELAEPKTMNDLIEISKAFTFEDPDQNNIDDTLGLAITKHLWDPVMGITNFMAGFGAYPGIWIENEYGELVHGGVQEEVKEALSVLQNMYKAGILDDEFFLKDGNKVKKQIAAGKIGILYGEQWGSFVAGVSREQNPDAQWKPLPIVSVTGKEVKVPLKYNSNSYLVVKKGTTHPEAIMKMINLYLEKNWGETSEYELFYSTPYPVWQLSPINPYPASKNLDAFRQLEAVRASGNFAELEQEAKSIYENIIHYFTENNEAGWGWEKTYGVNGAFSILEQYIKNDSLLYDRFYGPPTTTMVEMKTILDNYIHDSYVEFILGRSMNEFDLFVEKWKEMGGREMTEEVNEWYQNQSENTVQVNQ